MDIKELEHKGHSLLMQALDANERGEYEEAGKMLADSRVIADQIAGIRENEAQIKALSGDYNRPVNTVPVASTDVAEYNPNDTTAKTKANYKPATWVKGLPAASQPVWVQEQMGDNLKDEARVQTDTFIKWMKSPSEDVFWKTATPDEVKAMQEDKILCPIS